LLNDSVLFKESNSPEKIVMNSGLKVIRFYLRKSNSPENILMNSGLEVMLYYSGKSDSRKWQTLRL
jgi:hypothetical protein